MAGAAGEARAHLEQAEKALKTSFLSLKFSPDVLTASLEYSQAATKFRQANMLAESAAAWKRAGESKDGAGRPLRRWARLRERGRSRAGRRRPGGPVGEGGPLLPPGRQGGGGRRAALEAGRAAREGGGGDMPGAKAAFEDAIEVFAAEEKDYNLADVYRGTVHRLPLAGERLRRRVQSDRWARRRAGEAEADLLRAQGGPQQGGHHAAPGGQRAEEALNRGSEFEGWWSSKDRVPGGLRHGRRVPGARPRGGGEARQGAGLVLPAGGGGAAGQAAAVGRASGRRTPAGGGGRAGRGLDPDDPDGLC
ncbi:unnamed protein product [Prorocentrum cordatum]|uniref:KIF-binding protein n=1 Tax=Prorocentrum cordatum TaxID=2364126 RepID=A0ABN9TVW6_9DINO|nr:unnamed protein product [Polarella glacialis]